MADAEQSAQPEGPPTLEYAQRQRLAWVSRHARKLILLPVCIAIAAPIWWYWQPIRYWMLWHSAFSEAAAFKMPAKAIDIFIDDPVKARRVAGNPDYIPFAFGITVPGGPPQLTYSPSVYRSLSYYDSRSSLARDPYAAIAAFMGMLHRPDGTPRLVIVSGGKGLTSNLLYSVTVLVVPEPRWTDLLPRVKWPQGRLVVDTGPSPTGTRLRSGVADPSDPSHIVFEFEAGPPGQFNNPSPPPWVISSTGIIDARLQNDDSMTFTLRSFSGDDPNLQLGVGRMAGDVKSLQAAQAARYLRATSKPFAGWGRAKK